MLSIRCYEQCLRKPSHPNCPDNASLGCIEDDQLIASALCDPNLLSIRSEFQTRWAVTSTRKSQHNTIGSGVEHGYRIVLEVTHPELIALRRHGNPNRLPTHL